MGKLSEYNFDHVQDDRPSKRSSNDNSKDVKSRNNNFKNNQKNSNSSSHNRSFDFKKYIPLIIAAFIALIIINTISYIYKPPHILSRYLSTGEYSLAAEYYNNHIFGKSKYMSEADLLLKSYIEGLEQDYYSHSASYQYTKKCLNELSTIHNSVIADNALSVIAKIKDYEDQKNFFISGKEKYNNKEYLSAMCSFSKVTDSFTYYSDAQEHYKKCRDILLSQIGLPKTKDEYKEAINTLNTYISSVGKDDVFVERRAEFEDEYKSIILNEKRNQYLKDAEEKYTSGEVSAAFNILEKGIKDLSSDSVLAKQLEEYHSQYINAITDTVSTMIDAKEYNEAIQYILLAREEYSCEQFYDLEESVYVSKENSFGKYDCEEVCFLNYSGTIRSDDDVDEYSFTASEEGAYCLTFSEMEYNFEIYAKIINSLKEVIVESSIINNDTLSTEKIPAGDYMIEISSSSNTGSYEFTIGLQKPSVDINQYACINDSIEFAGQTNYYDFTPEYTGIYRFDFSELLYGTEIGITIYDHLGEPIFEDTIAGEEGVTPGQLKANEDYKIRISHSSGLSRYILQIGRQRPERIIEEGFTIDGGINFINQSNTYIFTPKSSRKYYILGNSSDWTKWDLEIEDENGYPIEYEETDESSIEVTLNSQKKYFIRCFYKESLTYYSFTIK